MWVLDLKILRDLAASFIPKDLFARNPTIFVYSIEPAFDDVKSESCQQEGTVKDCANTYVKSMSHSATGIR